MEQQNAVVYLGRPSMNVLSQTAGPDSDMTDSIGKLEVIGVTGCTVDVQTERMTAMRSTTIMFRTGHRHRGTVTIHHEIGDVTVNADDLHGLENAAIQLRVTRVNLNRRPVNA